MEPVESVESMIVKLKKTISSLLNQDLSLNDLFKVAQILKALVELEKETGGSEKEIKEFIERLLRKYVRLRNENRRGEKHVKEMDRKSLCKN